MALLVVRALVVVSACVLGVLAAPTPSAPPASGAEDRALGLILGSFVADAAAMPLHWIYDVQLIQKLVGPHGDPAFFRPVSSPYYKYPFGEQTPFGEQMFSILRSFSSTGGVGDIRNVTQSYYSYFMLENKTRSWSSYIDNTTRGFVENVKAGRHWPHTGAGDEEVNAEVHVLTASALAAIVPDMTLERFETIADTTIRIWQDNDAAVVRGLTFARILWSVVRLNKSIEAAIQFASEALLSPIRKFKTVWDPLFSHGLAKMHEWRPRPPFNVTREIGQGCDFPYHTFTSSQFLLHNDTLTFEEAVRQTILIGGENGARGMMTAGVIAATQGVQAIPTEWQSKTARYPQLETLARSAVQAATSAKASAWYPTATQTKPAPAASTTTTTTTTTTVLPHTLTNSAKCVGNANASLGLTLTGNHSADHVALRALYLSSGGPGWTRNACWLNDTVPICQWDQVLCNDQGRVRELRLSMNNLTGTLPDEMGLLSELQFVQVVLNSDLTGPIPASLVNTTIQEFYAWETQLTSLPDNIGQWAHLTCLDVSDCNLSALPESLAQLRTLNTAYLDGNRHVHCPVSAGLRQWIQTVEFHAVC